MAAWKNQKCPLEDIAKDNIDPSQRAKQRGKIHSKNINLLRSAFSCGSYKVQINYEIESSFGRMETILMKEKNFGSQDGTIRHQHDPVVWMYFVKHPIIKAN